MNRSVAAFNRINIGIANMVTMVAQADLETMHGMLSNYQTGYESHHAIIVYNLEILIEEASVLMGGVVDGSVLIGEHTILNGILKLVNASLDALKSVDSIPDQGIKDAPSHLMHNDRNDCDNAIKGMEVFLNHSSVASDKDNPDISVERTRSYINKLHDFYKMQRARGCITGLVLNLNTLLSLTADLEGSMKHVRDAVDGFNFEDLLKKMRSDLDILKDSIDGLSEQLLAYSRNKNTKINISNEITDAMLSDIEKAMNHIISVITVDVIEPFLLQTSDLNRNIPLMYLKTLNTMRVLEPHYDDRDIENKLRALKIWRHPEAMLNTVDVLQFTYSASEAWRTWALSVSLDDLVLSGSATKLISSMVNGYTIVLRYELLRMKSEFENARNDVIENFKKFLIDLNEVRMESIMEDDFIL